MAPTFVDCGVASLYCAEEVSETTWDEEEESDGGGMFRVENAALSSHHQQQPPLVFLDFPVEDEEAISTLLLKEAQYMPEPDYSARYYVQELDARARLEGVQWIQKVQSFFNYGPLTVALAVNYMDRFLSRHQLPEGKEWMLQLLSVACISLAAKMEESEVPTLLDLQVEQVEHVFEAPTIQRMELLVLSTLEWRMCVVTPFSYIDYFFHKLGISNLLLRALLSRVSEIVLKVLRDPSFLSYLPSVVAASSIICSLQEVTALHSGDLLRSFARLSVDVAAVKDCYNDMQELLLDSIPRRLSQKRKAVGGSEPQSPVGVLEAAALSSASEGTLGGGFSSRESSPGVEMRLVGARVSTTTTAALPPKRRKLLADEEELSTTTWLQHTYL